MEQFPEKKDTDRPLFSTTLHQLCATGSISEIQRAINRDPSQINQLDKKGYAPLHYACARSGLDRIQILSLLLSLGVDVNIRSLREGDTALHMVLLTKDSDEAVVLALKLLSHGADPEYRNDKHRNAYDIAMARDLPLMDILLEGKSPSECERRLKELQAESYSKRLVRSVIQSKTEDIGTCLALGADCNFINEHGAGAIHYCVTHYKGDKVKLIKDLYKAGADVNLLDHERDNALNLVLKTSSLRDSDHTMLKLVENLINWGSRTDCKDLDGNDAKSLADSNSYLDIQEIFRQGPQRTSTPVYHSPANRSLPTYTANGGYTPEDNNYPESSGDFYGMSQNTSTANRGTVPNRPMFQMTPSPPAGQYGAGRGRPAMSDTESPLPPPEYFMS